MLHPKLSVPGMHLIRVDTVTTSSDPKGLKGPSSDTLGSCNAWHSSAKHPRVMVSRDCDIWCVTLKVCSVCLSNLRVSLCVKQCHTAFRLHELKSKGKPKESHDPKLQGQSWTWAWLQKVSCAITGTGLHVIRIARASLALSPPRLGPVRKRSEASSEGPQSCGLGDNGLAHLMGHMYTSEPELVAE